MLKRNESTEEEGWNRDGTKVRNGIRTGDRRSEEMEVR